jgi:lipopolysaccharide transport system permease protein
MGIKQNSISRLRVFFKYRELFFQLVSRDIKLKYRRSVLGYLWSVLNPLFTMVIMTVVFSAMLARGIANFPVYLLSGSLLFSFMSGAVGRAIPSVVGGAALLKKIYIPKYIFTLASVTSELITMFFSLGALVIVVLATGLHLSWRIFFILVPIVELYAFSIGLGLLLAQATVFFRDVQYLWGVFATSWMYLTPIFYPASLLPERVRFAVVNFNPMYYYVTLFRACVLGSEPYWRDCLWRGALAAGFMLLIGIAAFIHNQNKFVLYI